MYKQVNVTLFLLHWRLTRILFCVDATEFKFVIIVDHFYE